MSTPTFSEVQDLLGESWERFFRADPGLFNHIIRLAERIEALREYNPKQAIFVAADIVRHKMLGSLNFDQTKKRSKR